MPGLSLTGRRSRFVATWARPLPVALALALALVVPGGQAEARKKPRAMTHDEVAQTWVGESRNRLYLLRLELREDGTGTGGYVFVDEAPKTFAIASWSYRDGKLEVQPASSPATEGWVGPLRGVLTGSTFRLVCRGDDWKIDYELWQESVFRARWDRLIEAMDDP